MGTDLETKTNFPAASAATSLDNFLDSFIAGLDVRPITRNSYRKKTKAFFTWMIETGIRNPRRQDILSYRGRLIESGLSPLTVSAYLTPLRLFFTWMESEGKYPNITAGIKGPKKPQGFRKESLTVPQIQKVLSTIDRDTPRGKRDFAIINLLFRTGIRTIEAITADIGDIRQEAGIVVLDVKGKGHDSKDQFVLLTDKTLDPIYEYLGTRADIKESDPLFISVSNNSTGGRLTTRSIRGIVKYYFQKAGLNSPRITTHSTRHTFATQALLNGAQPMQVKEALRHKDLQTTMIYTHVINRTQDGAEKYINF
jgi:site-specific recombinase XerD